MSEETIDTRLKNNSTEILKAYDAWSKNKKDREAREKLQECVHELRKIGARIEIDLATADRNEGGQKRIPIPPHRAASNKGRHKSNMDNDSGKDALPSFINNGSDDSDSGVERRVIKRRGRKPKTASGEE